MKDYPWSTLCLQEFTASKGEVVSETSEGHKVFVTPPCKGQLRLAIVVSTEVLASMKMDPFRVQGRNCSLDVYSEGKKFRVDCFHLSPTCVIHVYAKDLDDLRVLTNGE